MDGIEWSYSNGKYILNTFYGEASIFEVEERKPGSKLLAEGSHYQYSAQFNHNDGSVRKADQPFDEFEHAEGWLLFGVIMNIDQPGDDLSSESVERLISTLDLCQQFLQEEIHPSYLQRIEIIEEIIRGKQPYRRLATSVSTTEEHLDWQERGLEYSVDTRHGKAIIGETQENGVWHYSSTSSYTPRIEYVPGAVLRGYPDVDFEAAAAWVNTKLKELDYPTGGEGDLDNLTYTLQICASALPERSDPIHHLRLKWIETRISDILL